LAGAVIVGAGECGTRAAFALRDAGYTGKVVLIGREPHKPYERPPLSKPSIGEVAPKLIAGDDRLAAADISLVLNDSVVAIDKEAKSVTLASGRTVSYSGLLLATGTQPRALPVPGGGNALKFRTLDDARTIFGVANLPPHCARAGSV
jgi:3-phenylpropionate/trans-cinnamate dioxygenase ferredoxin reductase subunit